MLCGSVSTLTSTVPPLHDLPPSITRGLYPPLDSGFESSQMGDTDSSAVLDMSTTAGCSPFNDVLLSGSDHSGLEFFKPVRLMDDSFDDSSTDTTGPTSTDSTTVMLPRRGTDTRSMSSKAVVCVWGPGYFQCGRVVIHFCTNKRCVLA